MTAAVQLGLERRRGRRSFAILLWTAAMIPTAASGQALRVELVDSATAVPLRGALVALVDASGRAVTEVLTSQNGFGDLAAPAGTYRLRVRRIGYQLHVSAPLAIPHAGRLTVTIPAIPVVLSSVTISARSNCGRISSSADGLGTVWDEVAKALQASRLTIDDLQGVGGGWTYRTTTGAGGAIEASDTSFFTISNQRPFGAIDAAELAQVGYVVGDETSGWRYYGPDETVLLSPEFAATHCFRLERDGAEPDLIGISFRPIPSRRVADIAGTAWVDQRSSELRRISFRFVNAGLLSLFGGGGETRFERLASGAWLVSAWHLRAPKLQRTGQVARSVGFYESGGGILSVEAVEARRASERAAGTVTALNVVESALRFGKPARYAGTAKFDLFYERRAGGRGIFFTLEDISRMRRGRVIDLLASVPGVTVFLPGGVPAIRVARCPASGMRGGERNPRWLAVFVNGQRISSGLQVLADLDASGIEALELYRGASELPVEARGNACAAIFVWTRFTPGEIEEN